MPGKIITASTVIVTNFLPLVGEPAQKSSSFILARMSLRRKLLILAAFLAVVAVAAFFIYRHSARPPEIARLLPEGDVIVYANLKPAHLWNLSQSTPVVTEGDYQNFINQTGIQFERDLDEVAMSRRDTADGRDTESTEIFAGRFDPQKLKAYLESISAQRDSYHGRLLYIIPHEGHTVRVCVLDTARVAVTNMASSDPMHEIIDGLDSSPAGPSLLQTYYSKIPVASLGWLLLRNGTSQAAQLPGPLSFDFLNNTVTVGSVRYEGDLKLRADVISPSDDSAKQVVDSASGFLAMYRTVAKSVGAHGTDPDIKAAIDSIHVEQNKNVAVFTATLSQRVLKKLVSDVGPLSAAPASPTPAPKPRRHHSRRRHKPTEPLKPPAE